MSESTAIVKQQITLNTWQMLREAAPIMHRSRFFGVSSEEQAIAIMAKGYELGLGMTTSFEYIVVIENKPTLIPRGALALAYQSGQVENFKVIDTADDKGQPYSCTVSGHRIGGNEYSVTFSMDDAKRAGLLITSSGKKAANWEHYPANMLKWRAVGFWLDIVFPDVQGGMKRADEFGATVDASGNVIEGTVVQESAPIHTEYVTSLDALITQYGVESVMDAIANLFQGNMPSSTDEMKSLSIWLDEEQAEAEVTNG